MAPFLGCIGWRSRFWFFVLNASWIWMAGAVQMVSTDGQSPAFGREFGRDRGQKPIALPESLLPLKFEPLPLGSIKPGGWLLEEVNAMASGLAGKEYDFYQVVRDSTWLGGNREYSDLNEALPYWINGVVPLAYETGDQVLLDKIKTIVRNILSRQQADGWLGPETDMARRNFWARTPFLLGLLQMVEAEEGSQFSQEILNAIHHYLEIMHSMLANNLQGLVAHEGDQFNEQWGRSRAPDMILVLQWLYDNNPRDNEKKLLECMEFFRKGGHDWSWWYSEDVYPKVDLDTLPNNFTSKYYHFEHGVNVGQGLKAGAVIRRFTHNEDLLGSARRGVDWTFRYHGTPSGGVIADERLSGLSPVRGVELCSVVETMYSLSYLYQATGERNYADRCELAAYNALPVMVTTDWWAHQYIAQTNQPISHIVGRSPWHNVGTNAQTFGLEPNYPCCTVNFPQGYPKFISNMFVRRGSNGIAHALLGPGTMKSTTDSGVQVEITCDTKYPFENTFRYRTNSDKDFELDIRVPEWAILRDSRLSLDGRPQNPIRPDSGSGMHRLRLRKGSHVVEYSLAANIQVVPRANDTVSIYHGALLYTVPLNPDITYQHSSYPNAPPLVREYTMTPRNKWALAIDPSSLQYKSRLRGPLPKPVWGEGKAVSTISATVCEIKWELTDQKGHAPNPPDSGERSCIGKPFKIDLVPYGTAKLHMAELPVMKR